ncbi:hypothetical protein GFL21_22065 [Rhizobium anhuiense]|uniref:hypothetical protein n=1 Tax=Rhizobium anhuiense TaxID=1184720 RepID=UPI00144177C8|nr:hypothetical protein [Rhizobium anhuiense]NKM57179.1 hypothetical protein [Rhizobium anhuiense]
MTRNRRKRPRISNGERFFQMHQWLLNSAAWKSTNVYERALYMELKQRYNGSNNGEIPLSRREAEAAMNCSDKPVIAAFKGLQEKGFIKVATRGSFHWKKGGGQSGRSTRWILTEYPIDYPVKSLSPERDFMRWKPADAIKARDDESSPMGGREQPIVRAMGGREQPVTLKVADAGSR